MHGLPIPPPPTLPAPFQISGVRPMGLYSPSGFLISGLPLPPRHSPALFLPLVFLPSTCPVTFSRVSQFVNGPGLLIAPSNVLPHSCQSPNFSTHSPSSFMLVIQVHPPIILLSFLDLEWRCILLLPQLFFSHSVFFSPPSEVSPLRFLISLF